MKVVQIVPSLETRHGGPSVSVPALAHALAAEGHDVTLLATGPHLSSPAATTSVRREVFARDRPEMLCPSRGLAARLTSLETDVLHHHGLWLRPLHYAHQRARRDDTPLVISPRGMMAPWAWRHHRWKKMLANQFVHPGALNAARGWHATSAAEADDIRSRGFSQPICVAPNGVAAPTAEASERASAYWQAKCPDAFQRPTALFFARFHPKKRARELIALWLAEAPRDWLLLVVGIPETYSVADLAQQVEQAGGSSRVKVFDGSAGPPPYVAACLYLLPSHSENFGLTVAEALAHGLPALVTDTTPWQSLASAGHGWCVPWAEFPTALARALAEGPERLRTRGERARAWVLAGYSWAASAHRLAEFYTGLIAGTRP